MPYHSARRPVLRHRFHQSRRFGIKTGNGFTLIELLVVIAIMLALLGAIWFTVKPLELAKRAKDSGRLVDLYNLNNAIEEVSQNSSSSLADTLCVGGMNQGLCQGQSNLGGGGNRALNGSGWVKVNLTGAKQLSTLPVDPINDGTYHYTYVSDGQNWELDAKLESDQYINDMKKMSGDTGNNSNMFEIGTDLNLIP